MKSTFSGKQLREATALLKRRESLVSEIKKLDKEIKKVMKVRLKPVKKKVSTRRKGTFKNLRVAMQKALIAAGKKGVHVSELSKKFKLSTNNIYSWFYTTGAKNRKIKKVAPGTYAYVK